MSESFQSITGLLGVAAALAGAVVAIRIAQVAQLTAAESADRDSIQFSNEAVLGAHRSLANLARPLNNLCEIHAVNYSIRDEIGNSLAEMSMDSTTDTTRIVGGELGEARHINVGANEADRPDVIPFHSDFERLRGDYIASFREVALQLDQLGSDPIAREIWNYCAARVKSSLNTDEIFDIGRGPSVFAMIFKTAATTWERMEEGEAHFRIAQANYYGGRVTSTVGTAFGLMASLEHIVTLGRGGKYGASPLGFCYALFSSLPGDSESFSIPISEFYGPLLDSTSGVAFATIRGLDRSGYALWYGEVVADFLQRYELLEVQSHMARMVMPAEQ